MEMTNESTKFSYEEREQLEQVLDFLKIVRIIVPIILGLITVTGIVDNTLTIIVVLRHKDINSIADILIINLAVADILFIVFCIPFETLRYTMLGPRFWFFGNEWCRVQQYVTNACNYTSMYTLVLISLDRYLALVHPIRSLSLRTKRNCYKALIVIWSIVLLGNIPMIFLTPFCVGVNYMEMSSIQMLYVCLFIFEFVLPIISMCFLYGHMLKIYLTGNIPGLSNHISRVVLQYKRRVSKMVIIVVMVFTICRLPFHIVSLYVLYSNDVLITYSVLFSIYIVSMGMYYLHFAINPILYTVYSKKFRNDFWDLLTCKSRNDLEHGTGLNRQ